MPTGPLAIDEEGYFHDRQYFSSRSDSGVEARTIINMMHFSQAVEYKEYNCRYAGSRSGRCLGTRPICLEAELLLTRSFDRSCALEILPAQFEGLAVALATRK